MSAEQMLRELHARYGRVMLVRPFPAELPDTWHCEVSVQPGLGGSVAGVGPTPAAAIRDLHREVASV